MNFKLVYKIPDLILWKFEELKLVSDLVGKKGPDVVKKLQLLLQGVTALLRNVHDVKDRRSQVSQSRDGLHLDGVPLLQGVVKDARSVDHLRAERQCDGV